MKVRRIKPKQDDEYYYIRVYMGIIQVMGTIYRNDNRYLPEDFHINNYKCGNCFFTEKEAKRVEKKIKKIFEQYKMVNVLKLINN